MKIALDEMYKHSNGDDLREAYLGRPFPWTILPTLHGGAFNPLSLEGRIVHINIWATTCGPCISEFPELNKLHEKYKTKDVAFISIGEDSSERAGRILKKYPFNYLHLVGGKSF